MGMQKISFMNAVRDGIAEEMRKNDQIFMVGEGISERGGSYGQTQKLWLEFGPERIIDTPISENGFTALASGAAMMGMRPIIDLMICDLMNEMASQFYSQAAKVCYMSNGQINCPLVVRAQGGGGTTGPHHSSTLYSIPMHFPGIKVVYPGSVYDAKGLMKTALHTNNPVFFCEDKTIYGKREEIPEEEYYVPFNEGRVVKEGKDVTVVAIGGMQYRTKEWMNAGKFDADIELIDPRCLYPLNFEEIKKSLLKTGRLVVVEDDFLTCGAGAEIAARVMGDSELYNALKAPIQRVAIPDIPHPYAPTLVKGMFPNEEFVGDAIKNVLK